MADGNYEVIGWYHDDTTLVDLVYAEGSTSAGTTTPIDLTIPEDARTVPQAPDVQAGPNLHVTVGQSVTFAGAFSDINPDDSHTIDWDFGDRTTSAGILTPAHTYIATGQYTATLTITDSTNFVVSDTLLVDVTGPALDAITVDDATVYSMRNTTAPGSYDEVQLADLNNDSHLDLIATDGASDQGISYAFGSGDGTFGAPAGWSAGLTHVAITDFNDDTFNDWAVAMSYPGYQGWSTQMIDSGDITSYISPGPGERPTQQRSMFNVDSAGSIVAVDFDQDGIPDLASANPSRNRVDLWRGRGDGRFDPLTTLAVDAGPELLQSGDIDGDTIPDLVVIAGAAVQVFQSAGDGTFAPPQRYVLDTLPYDMTLGDLNGDAALDIVMTTERDGAILIMVMLVMGRLRHHERLKGSNDQWP